MPQRLSIALSLVKAGDNSEGLKSEKLFIHYINQKKVTKKSI